MRSLQLSREVNNPDWYAGLYGSKDLPGYNSALYPGLKDYPYNYNYPYGLNGRERSSLYPYYGAANYPDGYLTKDQERLLKEYPEYYKNNP